MLQVTFKLPPGPAPGPTAPPEARAHWQATSFRAIGTVNVTVTVTQDGPKSHWFNRDVTETVTVLRLSDESSWTGFTVPGGRRYGPPAPGPPFKPEFVTPPGPADRDP